MKDVIDFGRERLREILGGNARFGEVALVARGEAVEVGANHFLRNQSSVPQYISITCIFWKTHETMKLVRND